MVLNNLMKKGSVSDNPDYIRKKSELIIDKLAKHASHPNPLILDELKKLPLNAKGSGGNVKDYLKQAKVYLGELLKENKNIDSSLIEKYLNLIVEVSSAKKEETPKQDEVSAKKEETPKQDEVSVKKEETPKQDEVSVKKEIRKSNNSEEKKKVVKEKDVTETKSGEVMLGLIMDEVKELVDSSSKVSHEVKDKQETFEKQISEFKNQIHENKKEIEGVKEQIHKIQSNIEKFIGLYEVVSKMYNPFLEKEDMRDTEKTEKNKSQSKEEEGNFFEKELTKQKQENKKKIQSE